MSTRQRHIPPGREQLWQRQAESDARLAQLNAQMQAAQAHAEALAEALDPDDAIVEDANREVERLHDDYCREVAVNDRVYTERLAGLTSHLDHDPTAPICDTCQGTGGPPGHDAHGACPTCRGWGRESRPPIPVWHDADEHHPAGWYDPATGRPVDLLADPAAAKPGPSPQAAAPPTTSSSGDTMTSADTYSGLRGRITGIASRAPERQGPLQQALQGVEEDIAELNSISEDSSQPGIQEALGSLMRAKESIEEAIWMVGAAQASTEGAAAALQ